MTEQNEPVAEETTEKQTNEFADKLEAMKEFMLKVKGLPKKLTALINTEAAEKETITFTLTVAQGGALAGLINAHARDMKVVDITEEALDNAVKDDYRTLEERNHAKELLRAELEHDNKAALKVEALKKAIETPLKASACMKDYHEKCKVYTEEINTMADDLKKRFGLDLNPFKEEADDSGLQMSKQTEEQQA